MERLIAKDLLSIGAVFLRPEQPFTWASGIKSPIYCDNRLTLSAPAVRDDVERGLAELVKRHFPECEVLMGTSTAGIAHAAITATILGLPMGYVRSGAKDHGRTNRIEGRLERGQKVVVIEDLISTGGSCIEVVEALREADAIYLDEIRQAGLYDTIWQAFAVILPVKTVGVMGDGRTYDHVCALRAVTSVDGMTADFYPFDMAFLGRVATRIINEVKGINRVTYDITSKPPGTIEWE